MKLLLCIALFILAVNAGHPTDEKKPERMCKMDCRAVKCSTCADGEVEIRETCRCCSKCVKPIAKGDSCQIDGRGMIPCEAGLSCIENKCQEKLDCKTVCRLVSCVRPICAEGEVLQNDPCNCCLCQTNPIE